MFVRVCKEVLTNKNNEIYIKSKTIIIDKTEHLTNLAKFMLFLLMKTTQKTGFGRNLLVLRQFYTRQ